MKKSLIVLQDGYKECGAASLLSIIRYYNGNVSMSRLIELTSTDQDGTDFYHLKLASEEIGLEAVGCQVDSFNRLKEIHKPFICQIIQHHYEHFVVVYEIRKNKVILMDPACGERSLSREDFELIWTSYVMIFSPAKKLISYKEEKCLNEIIKKTIQNNKSIVLNILFLSIIFMIMSFFCALYFEFVLDYVLDTVSSNLLVITFIFAILSIIKCIANFFRNELLIYLNQKIDCSILFYTFQKILLLPYSYYKNRTTGEVISRINDLIFVKNVLNKIILTVFLDLVVCFSCSIILFFRNTKLFLLLVIIIIIYVFIFYLFRPRLKRYTEMSQNNSAKLNSYLIETISGFETIKNMHLESVVNCRIEELYLKSLNDSFQYDNIGNLELFMKDIVSFIGILLVQFLGFSFVMNGQMSFGSLLTFTFLANYILEPINHILNLNKEYFYAANSIRRANHLFEIESENLNKTTNFVLKGNIFIHHLSFCYKEDQKILNDVTVRIREGERIMILGSSGSGKSTILKLLLKYYHVHRDSIYLDGIDLNDFSISNVREQISCVSQNEFLYHDTIKNNIVANRRVTDEEFLEVARLTCVDDFVKTMFLGYDTKLEENGLNLSGGQRQRIVLARMLLKASKIMLIDEGLNAVDIDLERKILKNIFSKYCDKTIIIVSHRTENLDLFDQIIQLKKGEIVDEFCYSKEISI